MDKVKRGNRQTDTKDRQTDNINNNNQTELKVECRVVYEQAQQISFPVVHIVLKPDTGAINDPS